MQSIEDARGALIAHLISHCGDKGHPEAQCCEPLADAYALAVVEEVLPDPAAGAMSSDPVVMSLMSVKKHIRGRIRALGR